jgi:hypothetical protein
VSWHPRVSLGSTRIFEAAYLSTGSSRSPRATRTPSLRFTLGEPTRPFGNMSGRCAILGTGRAAGRITRCCTVRSGHRPPTLASEEQSAPAIRHVTPRWLGAGDATHVSRAGARGPNRIGASRAGREAPGGHSASYGVPGEAFAELFLVERLRAALHDRLHGDVSSLPRARPARGRTRRWRTSASRRARSRPAPE